MFDALNQFIDPELKPVGAQNSRHGDDQTRGGGFHCYAETFRQHVRFNRSLVYTQCVECLYQTHYRAQQSEQGREQGNDMQQANTV